MNRRINISRLLLAVTMMSILNPNVALANNKFEYEKTSSVSQYKNSTVETPAYLQKEDLRMAREGQYVWTFKEENGKLYRRLYDAVNKVWLTDWILC